jgi:hypothetical protein
MIKLCAGGNFLPSNSYQFPRGAVAVLRFAGSLVELISFRLLTRLDDTHSLKSAILQ